MGKREDVVIQQNQECPTCPEGTVCADSDLLCINIPCTTTVVLLGLLQLNLAPLCIRLGSVGSLENVSDEERIAQVQQVVDMVKNTFSNPTA